MEYRSRDQQTASDEELVSIEAESHDEIYADSYPFWGDSLRIDPERVESIFEGCYKPKTITQSRRKRRLLELLDLDSIDGKTVLDVGCGNGALSVYMAMHGAQSVGFDISKAGIQRARRIAAANDVADRCEFSIQSASEMAYRSEQFDIVLCSNVLHHIWKYDGTQSELYRVLADDGSLVFDEGIRSNPVYRLCRDTYKDLSGHESELGDIDLEYSDLVEYGKLFSNTRIDCFTLTSGIKNFLGDDFDNPPHLRALFAGTMAIDAVLERADALDPYCLEIVGRFEK